MSEKQIIKAKDLEVGGTSVSFSLEEGESLGFISQTHADKKLIAQIINLRRTEGTLEVYGYKAAYLPKKLRHTFLGEIGYSSHEILVLPNLTVEENLRYAAELNSIKGVQARDGVQALLTFFKLEEVKDEEVQGLDKEIQALVDFSCAAIKDPRVVIVDHTFDVLDEEKLSRVVAFIEKMREHQVSFMVLSDNPQVLLLCCDHLYHLTEKTKQIMIDKKKQYLLAQAKSMNIFTKEALKSYGGVMVGSCVMIEGTEKVLQQKMGRLQKDKRLKGQLQAITIRYPS